jgi:glucose/mannose transport system permease protein
VRRFFSRYGSPIAMVSPSVILIAIFVYWMIGKNVATSMTDIHTAAQASGAKPHGYVGLANYSTLLGSADFQHSLRNLLLYTVVFLGGTLLFGFVWSWLLDRPVPGQAVFRSVLLAPMAVSFIAAGVVWRWLLNSNKGEAASGLNRLFQMVGLGFLQNGWWNNINWGISAIAMVAVWQMSGYVMAMFLAGFRGVPDELREAGRVDGANGWQLYRHVIFPQLRPVALSAVIVIAHMSLKAFDLIMSISKAANYQTKVPAIDMFLYKGSYDYANAATVGTILLAIVAILIIPYLVHVSRSDA